jgi:hypothetical protein
VLEADVGGEEFVERFVLGKGRGEAALAVLVENGGLGILEEDVGVGIAAVELLGDFVGEVVVGVFAFPKAVVEAESIFQRAIGADGLTAAGIVVIKFLAEQEVAGPGVGVDEVQTSDWRGQRRAGGTPV